SVAVQVLPSISRDNASRLLRWAIISEFWPFRAACIVGLIEQVHDDERPGDMTIYTFFCRIAQAQILKMVGEVTEGKPSSELLYDFSAVRRLLAMDGLDA
ncbi:unnamed protein product, partial [Ectocarpus fasciculatus]